MMWWVSNTGSYTLKCIPLYAINKLLSQLFLLAVLFLIIIYVYLRGQSHCNQQYYEHCVLLTEIHYKMDYNDGCNDYHYNMSPETYRDYNNN